MLYFPVLTFLKYVLLSCEWLFVLYTVFTTWYPSVCVSVWVSVFFFFCRACCSLARRFKVTWSSNHATVIISYLSMLLVIDYQSENVAVVKLTSPPVYMLSLARVTLTLWHATTDTLVQRYHQGWIHLAFERKLSASLNWYRRHSCSLQKNLGMHINSSSLYTPTRS